MEKLSSRIFDRVTMPVILALLVLQLVAAQTIWTLSTTDQNSEDIFALFVAVSLVSFSLISYIYRVDKRGDLINKSLLYGGMSILALLLLVALFI